MPPPLKVGEFDPLPGLGRDRFGAGKNRAQDGGRNSTADHAIEPVIVELLGSDFPFVYRAPAPFGLHPVFRREVFRNEPVRFRLVAEERKAAFVAHGDGQARVDKSLPVVGVVDDVTDGPLACNVGDAPVVAHAVAAFSFVFGKRNGGRANKSSVAR